MALITPLSRRPYNISDTTPETTPNILNHQQVTLTEWIYALVDVHIICNHIEFRRLLHLPKYAHRYTTIIIDITRNSNRYGSLYLPPYALAKVRQLQQDRKKSEEPVSVERTLSDSSTDFNELSHLNPTISSLTHGVGYLPMLPSSGTKKKKRHTPKVLSRVISGVSKSRSEAGTGEVPPTPVQAAPAPAPQPTPPPKIHSNITGTNWMDVEFTDQSDAEKYMYRDLRMTHKFLVRGKNYARDGKKIQTGPAIFRLVIMDLYEVETGTRHDHIASMGRAKQRIDALNRFPSSHPPLDFPQFTRTSIIVYYQFPNSRGPSCQYYVYFCSITIFGCDK